MIGVTTISLFLGLGAYNLFDNIFLSSVFMVL